MYSKRMFEESKFEVGDMVKVTNKSWFGGQYSKLEVGDVGEVVEVIAGIRYDWKYLIKCDNHRFTLQAAESGLELINKK